MPSGGPIFRSSGVSGPGAVRPAGGPISGRLGPSRVRAAGRPAAGPIREPGGRAPGTGAAGRSIAPDLVKRSIENLLQISWGRPDGAFAVHRQADPFFMRFFFIAYLGVGLTAYSYVVRPTPFLCLLFFLGV